MSTFKINNNPVTDGSYIVFPSTTTNVDISAVLLDPSAILVDFSTNYLLTTGNNDISFNVLAEDRSIKKKYNLTLRRLSNNTSLQTFKINDNDVIGKNRFDVSNGTTTLNISAVPYDSNAIVDICGNQGLQTGNNTLRVKVSAEDRSITTEYVIIVDVNSIDTSFKTFIISGNAVFDGARINVPFNTNSVTVNYETTDPSAIVIDICGNTNLKTGDNNVIIKVAAEERITQQTYNIIVRRLSNNTSLSTFRINYVDVNNGNIIYVPYGTPAVYVNAVPNDSSANVTIIGGSKLITGSNIVTVRVIAEDTTYTTLYTVTVNVRDNVCFKEGSKILCLINNKEIYVPIQDIRKGTLVKTRLNGYVPVDMIGKSKMYNPANSLRSKNRLYLCSPNKYPELTEDLIITGCHSILVDNITNEERQNTIELLNKIYITDKKYRLMACLDKRADTYNEEGLHTIWHLALEHTDYYMNYGIYANGLLVETCSKRMMKEFSGMQLV